MPEGHTIHRLAQQLDELRGLRIHAESPQGRFAAEAQRICGAVLQHARAHGKHLILQVSSGAHLHVHLGMRGKWLRTVDLGAPPLPQVRLRLATDAVAWDLIAPSRCELLDEAAARAVVTRLGPDPLSPDADADRATAALRAAPGAIGSALLDQTVIAGVGNVFRCEALHAIGVAPSRPCAAMGRTELDALWAVLQQMMSRAVEDGRIITVDVPDRLSLPESEARKVYKQPKCRDCDTDVVVSKVGGRTAYHCPREQPG